MKLNLQLLVAQRVLRPLGLRETRLSHLAVLQPDAQHGGELVREDAVALFVSHTPDAVRSRGVQRRTTPTSFYGIHLCGALFHTQGGLKVDSHARVLRPKGSLIPGLYAVGVTVVVISGKAYKGYYGGNELLAATLLGKISGEAAAEELASEASLASSSCRAYGASVCRSGNRVWRDAGLGC